ncbi:MAG: insulinase family protein [Gammaproteobacteria bacterium]|nr:insulinase family protein [Gammaproteobacteria bacterium]
MRTVFLLLFTLISTTAFSDVQSFKLDNGLTLLVKEDHRAPVAVTMVWYNVGSADEPGGLTGISHALEHHMFKGTPNYPLGVFSKTIAGLGGQENAFTSTDYTAYFEKIAAEHLPTSLTLEADRMQHLLLDEAEFTKEMKVIQEERRLRTDDNPQALTFERFLAAAHLSSPYHHPVIGWMNDIQHLTVPDVRRWYQRFYAPNNATVVVVGDVQSEAVLALVKKQFGDLKKQPTFKRKQQTEPRALGKKMLTVKAPANIPILLQGYTVPSVKTASSKHAADPYVLEVIAAILDAGESGRFSQNLIRGKEQASSIGVEYNLYTRYQTQFIIYGAPSASNTIEGLANHINAELNVLKTNPVPPDELKRVKTQLIAQKIFERDSVFGQAMELGLLESTGLGWQLTKQYEQRIRAVTAEEIQAAAKHYFDDTRMTEAHLLPQAGASQ